MLRWANLPAHEETVGVFLIIVISFGLPHGIGQIQVGNSCAVSLRERRGEDEEMEEGKAAGHDERENRVDSE